LVRVRRGFLLVLLVQLGRVILQYQRLPQGLSGPWVQWGLKHLKPKRRLRAKT
jgi:hypothetical protein